MGELVSLGFAAGLAAVLAGAIGVWTWWWKARSRQIDVNDACWGAAKTGSTGSSEPTEVKGLAEAESAEGEAGCGQAKGNDGLEDAAPDDGGAAGISAGAGKPSVHPIKTPFQGRERHPAEEGHSPEHTRENPAIDSGAVTTVETNASSDEKAEGARPGGDHCAAAEREGELEEEQALEGQGLDPMGRPTVEARPDGGEDHALGGVRDFPAPNGTDQMDINESQPSDAIESVVAGQDEFAVPRPNRDDMATENTLEEERPDDAETPGNAGERQEPDYRPSVKEPNTGSYGDTSAPEDRLLAEQATQSCHPPGIGEKEGPDPDSVEPPVEEAPPAAGEPSAQDGDGETAPGGKSGKQSLSGAQEGEAAVNPSTSSPAASGRKPRDEIEPEPRRYEGLTRRPPGTGNANGKERRGKVADSIVQERSLPIEVRLRFDRGGSCSISLISSRSPGAPENTTVARASGSLELSAMQDEWYQDVVPDDFVRILYEGTVWSEAGGTRRWSLSGRDLYVLGEHSDLSGWVSQPCLKLGRKHVILCTEQLRPAAEQVLREAGVDRSVALDASFGSPAGWVVIRDVVPVRPVPPSEQTDILNALRPLPDLEIYLEGGIRLKHATWLHGYPPDIRVYGDAAQWPEVLIDGSSAVRGDDGAYQVPAWDAAGAHAVWCAGISKSYSIVPFEASWGLWDAYAYPVAPGSGRRVSICGPLVGDAFVDWHDWSAAIQVPETSSVILGAAHGEQVLAARASEVSGMPCFASPSFRPVWALPADPHRCNKQASRIMFLGEYLEPIFRLAGEPGAHRHPAVDTWAKIILDSSRKRLAIEPDTERVRALWKRYKQAARGIWKSRK